MEKKRAEGVEISNLPILLSLLTRRWNKFSRKVVALECAMQVRHVFDRVKIDQNLP